MIKKNALRGAAAVLTALLIILAAACSSSDEIVLRKKELPEAPATAAQGGTSETASDTTSDHGHSFGEWTVKQPATCTESGLETRSCTVCGQVEQREIPALAHAQTELRGAVEPTLTENGYSGDEYCLLCGELISRGVVLPATGHDLKLINQKAATCTEPGYTGDQYCVECEQIIVPGTEIPPTGHRPGELENAKSPNCTQKGYSGDLYCTVCGQMIEEGTVLAALGHSFGQDVCTRCGVSKKEIYGDFGYAFPERFLDGGSAVVLKDDEAIRGYARDRGLKLNDIGNEGRTVRYLSFYRSSDICAALYSYSETVNGYLARYYVFDVYVRNLANFYMTEAPQGRQEYIRDLVASGEKYAGGEMIVAVNGDYISSNTQWNIVFRNGEQIKGPENVLTDVCVMYKDGTVVTYSPEAFDYESVLRKDPYQIWNFGPALLDADGKAIASFDETNYESGSINNVNPHTAIGYYEPGHYCFVVVDGRQNDENGNRLYGCSMKALASLMETLGCRSAYNFTNGNSAQAYMNGDDVRVIKDDQRRLGDIVCIGEVSDETE